jgi:hypothetical protein
MQIGQEENSFFKKNSNLNAWEKILLKVCSNAGLFCLQNPGRVAAKSCYLPSKFLNSCSVTYFMAISSF